MVTTENKIIEIEVDGPRNESLAFPPLQCRIRGRCDVNRIPESHAKELLNKWPEPIPGQRIRLDLDTGEIAIIDGLYAPEYRRMRERIAKGWELPPEKEIRKGVDVASCLYYMIEAVKAGYAKVTAGSLPETLPGTPKTDWYTPRRSDPQTDLAGAIRQMAQTNAVLCQMMQEFIDRMPPRPKTN